MILKITASVILAFLFLVTMRADYQKQVKHSGAMIFFVLLSIIVAAIWL